MGVGKSDPETPENIGLKILPFIHSRGHFRENVQQRKQVSIGFGFRLNTDQSLEGGSKEKEAHKEDRSFNHQVLALSSSRTDEVRRRGGEGKAVRSLTLRPLLLSPLFCVNFQAQRLQ